MASWMADAEVRMRFGAQTMARLRDVMPVSSDASESRFKCRIKCRRVLQSKRKLLFETTLSSASVKSGLSSHACFEPFHILGILPNLALGPNRRKRSTENPLLARFRSKKSQMTAFSTKTVKVTAAFYQILPSQIFCQAR